MVTDDRSDGRMVTGRWSAVPMADGAVSLSVMSKTKRKTPALEAGQQDAQLTRTEILGRYNAERARGIVHTAEWGELMAVLQARFDARIAEEAQREAEAYTERSRQHVNLK